MSQVKRIGFCVLLASALAMAGATPQEDVAGSKDHPFLSRMPGYYISGYKEAPFDQHEFYVSESKTQPVEGRLTQITYWIQENATRPSALQVVRNFENAVLKISGTVVYSESQNFATLKVNRQGREIWVEVDARAVPERYDLVIVEKAAMQQDVVANADSWLADIKQTGHAAVYGIYFDVDKADLKPESEPALKEIASMLRKAPDISIYLVGHTDGTGEMAHNMQLSEARAKACASALASRYGIAASRMAAYGVGPLCPVMPNDTEAGRAKNRRVELVKR